jgi:hypothetical protein
MRKNKTGKSLLTRTGESPFPQAPLGARLQRERERGVKERVEGGGDSSRQEQQQNTSFSCLLSSFLLAEMITEHLFYKEGFE